MASPARHAMHRSTTHSTRPPAEVASPTGHDNTRRHREGQPDRQPTPRTQLSKQQWDALRPLITDLYLVQNKTANNIKHILADTRSIDTTVRAIRGHLATWRLNRKNNRLHQRHLNAIVRKQRLREQQGKPHAIYVVSGRQRRWSDIKRLRRVASEPPIAIAGDEADVSTPSDLAVLSPFPDASDDESDAQGAGWALSRLCAPTSLRRAPNTPDEKLNQAATLGAIANWYHSPEAQNLPPTTDFDSYDLFWDVHEAVALAFQGIKAGWDVLHTVGCTPRTRLLAQNPKGFVMSLQRISWLPTFAISYDDSLDTPGVQQQQLLDVVQAGLEGEVTSSYGNHPMALLLRKVSGQIIDEEFSHHVLQLALNHFRLTYPAHRDRHVADPYSSEAVEAQTLFASTLTMLGKYQEAEELLLNARARASYHGDKIREIATCSSLATLRSFMSVQDASYVQSAYELHKTAWSEAKHTILANCGIGRYMLYGFADFCRVIPGHLEEAAGLFREAIALHQSHPARPNICWEITMVRHLYRIYHQQDKQNQARELAARHPEAFIMQDRELEDK